LKLENRIFDVYCKKKQKREETRLQQSYQKKSLRQESAILMFTDSIQIRRKVKEIAEEDQDLLRLENEAKKGLKV